MKPNVLIPMAGLGNRFLKDGFHVPKQLINIKDKHLIDISMKCINLNNCNLIFIIRDEHIYNFRMDEILKNKFGNDIKIVVLDHLTDGSVSSCLFANEYINNDDPLIIYTLDIEFFPYFDPHEICNIDGDGLLLTFKSNSINYSYVDAIDNIALKTAEKKAISNNACVGVYCFKKGKDFCKYAKIMIDKNIRTNNEFYIAPLFNLLINDNCKILTKEIEKIHVFGTPQEFYFYKNNVVKKIGEKPVAICSDHSGFICKENFKKILNKYNIKYIDYGTLVNRDCDYNKYIEQAVNSIKDNSCDYGFGFCKTGQGVNICANKHKGIRSALIYDNYSMEMAIRHNCANFFSVPSKNYDENKLSELIEIALNNSFDGGRHQLRIQELE